MAELLLCYCAILLCPREIHSLQLLTIYFTLIQIFSGGKAKINLHTTLKLAVFMLTTVKWDLAAILFI